MEGRTVTNQTAEQLQGVFFDADTFFNFVQDINDVYFLFLSSSDEVDIASTKYAYLLDIPLSPYVPKPTN
jgi:tetrahydromethanopterin S-methyltransferase subunit H